MKHWWPNFSCALLALLALASNMAMPSTAQAQDSAFDIEIKAPDDVSELLQRHLELQRYRAITDLSDDELTRLQTLAIADARQLLGTLGFFSPSVQISRRSTAADGSVRRVIQMQVDPGEATNVADVQIEFSGDIATRQATQEQRQRIESAWLLPSGQRFTQADWDRAKQQALRQLVTENYPTGRIAQTLADIDPDTHQARLRIELDSGALFYTGNMVIEGLQRYNAALVQRWAKLTPGLPYRQADLVAAQQRLSDSGYFESVQLDLDTQGAAAAAPVRVKLREVPLQKLVLGVGASTDSGPRLTGEHTYHHVSGVGWRSVSQIQLERNNTLLGTELSSPPDADNWRWVAAGLVKSQLLGSMDVTSQQLRAGRKQFSERIDRNIFMQYDRAESVGTDTAAPVLTQSLSANYAFAVRYYNQLPFPNAGWGWGGEIGGGSTLGSQPHAYLRLVSRWQGFVGLGQPSAGRLSLRGGLGAVFAEPNAALPSTQLFLTGGDNSVRGYGLNTIGVQLADASIAPGRYLSTASIEWQRPLRLQGRASAWESTVFLDAGAVANQATNLSLKFGLGVGARWHSPVGPLQVDLAYGQAQRRLRLHMNLGFTF